MTGAQEIVHAIYNLAGDIVPQVMCLLSVSLGFWLGGLK